MRQEPEASQLGCRDRASEHDAVPSRQHLVQTGPRRPLRSEDRDIRGGRTGKPAFEQGIPRAVRASQSVVRAPASFSPKTTCAAAWPMATGFVEGGYSANIGSLPQARRPRCYLDV